MNRSISQQEPRPAEEKRRWARFPACPRGEGPVRYATLLLLALLVVWGPVAGCSNSRYLKVRKVPKNPLEGPLNLLSHKGPQPTERTLQTLRRYDLEKLHAKDSRYDPDSAPGRNPQGTDRRQVACVFGTGLHRRLQGGRGGQ